MGTLLAFLHHLAAFTLVATPAIEFAPVRGELTVLSARRRQLTDLLFGMSSGVVLILACAAMMARGVGYFS